MSITMKIIKIVLLIFSASLAQANDIKDESTLKQQPQVRQPAYNPFRQYSVKIISVLAGETTSTSDGYCR